MKIEEDRPCREHSLRGLVASKSLQVDRAKAIFLGDEMLAGEGY